MGFEKPQDYADALKRLEGFPLTGLEVRDGHLFFEEKEGDDSCEDD